MKKKTVKDNLEKYMDYLKTQERSDNTIRKYRGDILKFCGFCTQERIEKETILRYRSYLMEHYSVNSVNSYLISLNGYLRWLNASGLTVRTIRSQRTFTLDAGITREEYEKLLAYARTNETYYYILRILGATGIRIGELSCVTVEAVCQGFMVIYSKRKLRQVYFPVKLKAGLQDYCKARGLTVGRVFPGRGKSGAIHPSTVWRFLKKAASECHIEEKKVYPHNFRHLFARTYIGKYHNLAELADLLGHSSIETTRIYVRSTGMDKLMQLNGLGL